jgi:hypothetical protein
MFKIKGYGIVESWEGEGRLMRENVVGGEVGMKKSMC